MYDEIITNITLEKGGLAKKLNKISNIYENIQLIDKKNGRYHFIGERKYGDNFKDLYKDVNENELHI